MAQINVGIVGYGFVGQAVAHGFQNQFVKIADPLYFNSSTKDFVNGKFDVIFICVPTPMGENGRIDSHIVEQVIDELKHLDTILVLKSTVTPDIVDRLAKEHGKKFVYNPEFLREATAKKDFVNPTHHVFGGDQDTTDRLQCIYEDYSICKPAQTFHVTPKEASFVKYGINCFLASKVLFWNQFEEQCERLGVNYNNVRYAIEGDPRIGESHMAVPGNDGRHGFGGACFTKDTAALVTLFPEFTVLKETIRANNKIRSQYELDDREKVQHVSYAEVA